MFDIAIIGSGPAALSAAVNARQRNKSVCVFGRSLDSSLLFAAEKVDNYLGMPDLSGEEMLNQFYAHAVKRGVEFKESRISQIMPMGDRFMINADNEFFEAKTLILAIGLNKSRGIEGEMEYLGKGVSYCATCDGPFFKNRRVVVVGGGDSACDEATYLATLASEVTLVHRKGALRAQKAVAEKVLNNPKIKVIFNTVVKEIKGKYKVEEVVLENTETGATTSLGADGVFIFVGMIPQTDLVEMLPKDEGGYIKTNESMETAIKGMYCVGDIRSKPFRQVVTATSDGATAAFSAGLYIRELKNEVYK